ncbi:heavy metal translocating P-type ATPase [Denitrovibrio acetiphilus DSM 12809]|uniref:P-type Zn(2+) transporter n=1 Tax=Denitrovibrio acetiphilus (strain DSM 12809 / NBRC 114555 / N2460) TaxID=522772 RepID=D4H150_DENA2|nr:heavy metal translocating P-type ATPase [Denitrovibrio acetiphilus]ADD68713.1 heavy metal translocating P-type ATPase [Denitrovibrio acetiphilus DSM 12809]
MNNRNFAVAPSETKEQCSCCSSCHEVPEHIYQEQPEEISSSRAVYIIANMCCPVEEALIRKKLSGITEITEMKFNLMKRMLTIDHELTDTTCIEEALHSINMAPQPVSQSNESVSVFSVAGMCCPAEEGLIKTKLLPMTGVTGLEFNLMKRTMKVRHSPAALPEISKALHSLNMGAELINDNNEETNDLKAPETQWGKIAAAGILAVFSEIFELMHDWGSTPLGFDINNWSPWGVNVISYLPMILAVIAIILGGFSTYKKGWIAVKNMRLNINALMSVAVTGAAIIGQYPEAAMVMVLFNLSEVIEAKALDRARNAIKNLMALAPETITVLQEDGTWAEVDIREVAIGANVRVKPGERIGLDGVITDGHSAVNQAPITGESIPVEKSAGDTVFAGTINESGSFRFQVTAGATDSAIARIIHAVEEAQGSRAPIQRFIDIFAKYYTPAVFIAAFLIAVIPPILMGHEWIPSIYTALVILVIGCPCALVISTPVTIVSGLAAATKAGILIKGGIFLEQGRKLEWLALDKTGTITNGKPKQTDFVLTGSLDRTKAVSMAASIAGRSDHPVSRAIADNAKENNITLTDVRDFKAIPGRGVSGIINEQKWYLGNKNLIKEILKCPPELEEKIITLEKRGKTIVAFFNNAEVQVLFAVEDTVKNTSAQAISMLKKAGVKTLMLTGDNEHAAKAIAEQVGVDSFRSGLLPEDKLNVIKELGKSGKVGMVGDGINDAPALAKADIGFAMAAAGTDTAIETADVALMDDDLRKIPHFIKLSKASFGILVQNITFALGIKAVFFTLTLMGAATMWMAVLADVGASMLVIANGLRAMHK